MHCKIYVKVKIFPVDVAMQRIALVRVVDDRSALAEPGHEKCYGLSNNP